MANIDYITHSNGDLLWVDAATRDGKGRNIYNVYLAKGDKNLALQNYIALNKQNGSLNYKALIATNNDTSIVLPKQTFSIYGYRCEITEDKEIKEFSSTDVDGN
jgi:hypothetical protein